MLVSSLPLFCFFLFLFLFRVVAVRQFLNYIFSLYLSHPPSLSCFCLSLCFLFCFSIFLVHHTSYVFCVCLSSCNGTNLTFTLKYNKLLIWSKANRENGKTTWYEPPSFKNALRYKEQNSLAINLKMMAGRHIECCHSVSECCSSDTRFDRFEYPKRPDNRTATSATRRRHS